MKVSLYSLQSRAGGGAGGAGPGAGGAGPGAGGAGSGRERVLRVGMGGWVCFGWVVAIYLA